jgi:hypothetical protein
MFGCPIQEAFSAAEVERCGRLGIHVGFNIFRILIPNQGDLLDGKYDSTVFFDPWKFQGFHA